MVIVIVILTVVLFIVVNLVMRVVMNRIDQKRMQKERLAALDIGLRLEVNEEAKSLKRVEVPQPKARILAVDDEAVILDSFRKILVLEGYSVDTVESGQEALGLIQKYPYDFVFTDLKMPEFDGIEVTKAVKHLRPDIDVIMITGFATVESAVDVMKYGAMDYVQKPFTVDELVEFVNKSLIRREARIERQRPPKVHLVTASSPQSASERVFNVPAGIFISPAHVWIRVEMTGEVRAGIDDFARKTLGDVEAVVVPRIGQKVRKGAPLFSIKKAGRVLAFPSPISGQISNVNDELVNNVELLKASPYETGWVCRVTAENLPGDLDALKIGAGAVSWYQEEIDRFEAIVGDEAEAKEDEVLEAFSSTFLQT